MNDEFTILVAERNRHVREFLRRELGAEGYRVLVAKDNREVLHIIEGGEPPDLLILDLEIPHAGGLAVLERLRSRVPPLPVVVHTFLCEFGAGAEQTAAFVEKSENTDELKATVGDVLRRYYPERCTRSERNGGEPQS